jgi:hypothetical protein
MAESAAFDSEFYQGGLSRARTHGSAMSIEAAVELGRQATDSTITHHNQESEGKRDD